MTTTKKNGRQFLGSGIAQPKFKKVCLNRQSSKAVKFNFQLSKVPIGAYMVLVKTKMRPLRVQVRARSRSRGYYVHSHYSLETRKYVKYDFFWAYYPLSSGQAVSRDELGGYRTSARVSRQNFPKRSHNSHILGQPYSSFCSRPLHLFRRHIGSWKNWQDYWSFPFQW